MAAANLTDEQDQALVTRDTSIALAAGAGCGKTFVLSERFLSHLDHDSPLVKEAAKLHQLVAITFTDAAAREMRRRIRQKCLDRADSAPTVESQDAWLALLRAIEAARVSTIHAFCTSLLREHAVEAGLDPTFGVLEQGAADVLVSETIDDVLRERLAAFDPPTMQLVAAVGLSRLKEQLRTLLGQRHDEAFAAWQTATPAELVAAWQTCQREVVGPAMVAELAALPAVATIVKLLESVTPAAKKPNFIAARAALLDVLPRLGTGEISSEQLTALLPHIGVQSICTAKDWPNADDFAAYRDACTKLRETIRERIPKPFDAAATHEAADLGLKLLRLASDTAASYELAKARAGKLDFDDLLFRAKELLTAPEHEELRARLSDDLRLLLVDEFQDTDRLQVELVRALCGDIAAGKLFFVGDINQSIYRFRGAQPDVFRALREEIPQPGNLRLTRNFRSQPAVLDFVNALFLHAFGGEYQPLHANRPQVTPEPAIEFLWTITPEKKERSPGGGVRAARSLEAQRIARRLRQLIDDQEPLIADADAADGRRALRKGDVAILFRALSDVAVYETALREYGLDYYLVGGHAYYAQQEIYDVLNLLRAVASSADEISLAGVLRSPFFALEDETLYWLASAGPSLNGALFAPSLPAELSNAELAKVRRAATTLAHLRGCKDSLPITALLDEALARTGYDAALLAEFLGPRKLANLNKLLEQARTADSGGVLDLDGFIAQLAEFVAREPKEALAATLSESADVIRLMTIHRAKGLEFPLVVVPDLDRRADIRAPAAAIDATLGPVIKPPDEFGKDSVTTGMQLYTTLDRHAEADERKRLFYVAATRAADYLILSSSLVGLEEKNFESDWTRLLAARFNLENGQLLGELPADYARPQVRVTTGDPNINFEPLGAGRGPNLVTVVQEARDLAASGRGVIPPGVGPLEADATARRQYSVSRLTGKLVRPDAREFNLAVELDPQKLDPLVLGTFVHAALARYNFAARRAAAELCELVAAERVVYHDARLQDLTRELVDKFAASPRAAAIAAAPVVYRELEFVLAWPPAERDGRYIQGYFDCIYQDAAGGWHLIDYKTNDISAAKVAQSAQQYEMQMLLYALALEQATGQPPVELALVFLRPGVEYQFEWNDRTRLRTIQLVNQAIRADDWKEESSTL